MLSKDPNDHGIIGGVLLAAKILIVDGKEDKKLNVASVIASKAIMSHNLVTESHQVQWKDDPLSCLLVICDQLQAWDREYVIDTERQKKNPCYKCRIE